MANVCDVNQLDTDVLLPPRKRLLAGLKKQSSDGDATASPTPSPVAVSSVTDIASPSSVSFSSEYESRLKKLLSSCSNNPNLTPDELVAASKAAAIVATKAAKAARAAAEEKGAIAAKAVAAAKSALDLAASFSEDSAERSPKKSKSKKHLPVQLLYKKNQPTENCGTDEEFARKLHRAINSSPRISKNSPNSNSNSKGSKHKKPKNSSSFEITGGSESDAAMAFGQDCTSLNNKHAVAGKIDSDESIHEICSIKQDKMVFKNDRSSQMKIYNVEAESSQSKKKNCGDLSPIGKKRGRMKLKKLPLSICTSKDRAQPKDGITARSSSLTEMNTDNHTVHTIPMFPMETSSDRMKMSEATSTWKCQEFKSQASIKQNKAVQS